MFKTIILLLDMGFVFMSFEFGKFGHCFGFAACALRTVRHSIFVFIFCQKNTNLRIKRLARYYRNLPVELTEKNYPKKRKKNVKISITNPTIVITAARLPCHPTVRRSWSKAA